MNKYTATLYCSGELKGQHLKELAQFWKIVFVDFFHLFPGGSEPSYKQRKY